MEKQNISSSTFHDKKTETNHYTTYCYIVVF